MHKWEHVERFSARLIQKGWKACKYAHALKIGVRNLLPTLLDKGGLANLETLALFDNAITNAGMLELANAIARGGLPRCWGITLRGNPGSPAPVKQAIARRTNSEALSA